MANEILVRETEKRIYKLLQVHGKCILVKCPGFGKTWILADIVGMLKETNVYYITPGSANKEEFRRKYGEKLKGTNLHILTYRSLGALYKKCSYDFKNSEIGNLKSCIFLFDEAHFMGANKASKAIDSLMENFRHFKFIGATSTPYRPSDNIDVVYRFFEGIMDGIYTIDDAIRDGHILEPWFIRTTFTIQEYVNSVVEREKSKDLYNRKSEKEKVVYIKNIKESAKNEFKYSNSREIIVSNIEKYKVKTTYMKFIIFFKSVEQMKRRCKVVESWFVSGFEEYTVKSHLLYGTSSLEDGEYSVGDILELSPKNSHIDLIMCVDMLSHGIHIDDLTGVVMLRETASQSMFIQQWGRCMSMDNPNRMIVFDLVGNFSLKDINSRNLNTEGISAERKERLKKEKTYQMISMESVRLDDYLLKLEDLSRRFNIERVETERGVYNLYNKNPDKPEIKDWAMRKLNLKSEDAFKKFIKNMESNRLTKG